MAAGLAIRPSAIPEFRAFLCEHLASEVAQADDALDVDALVSPEAATRSLLEELKRLAPFGPGNPEPLLALAGVRAERATVVRGGHVRCTLMGESGARLEAIAWRAEDNALGKRLLSGEGGLHVAGRLKANDWNGRLGIQFEIEDAADPRGAAPT
jgi:single-stranded-DNA-specific exonuclease